MGCAGRERAHAPADLPADHEAGHPVPHDGAAHSGAAPLSAGSTEGSPLVTHVCCSATSSFIRCINGGILSVNRMDTAGHLLQRLLRRIRHLSTRLPRLHRVSLQQRRDAARAVSVRPAPQFLLPDCC